MSELMSRSHLALVTGVVVAGAGVFMLWRKQTVSRMSSRSTTSSAGGGPLAYESNKAVNEYLQMHYATANELMPYAQAPKDAVNFPERCALLVERHCSALKDFTGEREDPIALDIGCAVGGASFHLTLAGFKEVMGLDYSRAFVDAAQEMKEVGSMPYDTVSEGCLTERRIANLPEGADASRVRFRVADACHLPTNLAPVDALLAANLICRLPDPELFLQRLPSLIKPGGVVVLTTPFSWLEAWTPKTKWLGGCKRDGKPVLSFDTLTQLMNANGFKLEAVEDMPFVIREHARKFQWGCAQGSVWIKQPTTPV